MAQSKLITFEKDVFLASEIVAVRFWEPDDDDEDKEWSIEIVLRGQQDYKDGYWWDYRDSREVIGKYHTLVTDWNCAIGSFMPEVMQ